MRLRDLPALNALMHYTESKIPPHATADADPCMGWLYSGGRHRLCGGTEV